MPSLPPTTPALIRERAELDTLRFYAQRDYRDHERMATSQGFDICLCSKCGAIRPFMEASAEPVRYCAWVDETAEGA